MGLSDEQKKRLAHLFVTEEVDAETTGLIRNDSATAFLGQLVRGANREGRTLTKARFVARLELIRQLPEAIEVLKRAQAGPTYLIGPDGKHVYDRRSGRFVLDAPEPTKQQLRAAKDILDRLGVNDDNEFSILELDVKTVVDQAEAEAVVDAKADGETDEERSLSRERLRSVLDVLRDKFTASVKKSLAADKRKMRRPVRKVQNTADVVSVQEAKSAPAHPVKPTPPPASAKPTTPTKAPAAGGGTSAKK